MTLPTGKVFRVESAARFAISCLALRAVIRAGYGGRPSVEASPAESGPDLGAVDRVERLFLPRHDRRGPARAGRGRAPSIEASWTDWSGLVTSNQGVEGEWPAADLFQVLDALLAAGTLEAQVTVRRSATALMARQRLDGTFGTMAQQERALIGLRALFWASRSPA